MSVRWRLERQLHSQCGANPLHHTLRCISCRCRTATSPPPPTPAHSHTASAEAGMGSTKYAKRTERSENRLSITACQRQPREPCMVGVCALPLTGTVPAQPVAHPRRECTGLGTAGTCLCNLHLREAFLLPQRRSGRAVASVVTSRAARRASPPLEHLRCRRGRWPLPRCVAACLERHIVPSVGHALSHAPRQVAGRCLQGALQRNAAAARAQPVLEHADPTRELLHMLRGGYITIHVPWRLVASAACPGPCRLCKRSRRLRQAGYLHPLTCTPLAPAGGAAVAQLLQLKH